ncbi:MAG: DUF4886 domain-containing protein [Bacteroidales bacterium]|nr:DUF4886 domain-containing protein [Bacteroidales bacterium]
MPDIPICKEQQGLPLDKESIKILFIGNSFTANLISYLPDILINRHVNNVNFSFIVNQGESLCDIYSRIINDSITEYHSWDNGKITKNSIGINELILSNEWDVITLQQVSGMSGLYSTYQPYLNLIVNHINDLSPNTCIAFHSTWSYASMCEVPQFSYFSNSSEIMTQEIIKARNKALYDSKIKVLINSTEAIDSLRRTHKNNPPLDLTYDGLHLADGIPLYLVACVLYETIIAPINNNCILDKSFYYSNKDITITQEDAYLCQKIAHYFAHDSHLVPPDTK